MAQVVVIHVQKLTTAHGTAPLLTAQGRQWIEDVEGRQLAAHVLDL